MLKDRLTLLLRKEVTIITKSFLVIHSTYEGKLILVDDEYIILDTGKKKVIVPMSEINAVKVKD